MYQMPDPDAVFPTDHRTICFINLELVKQTIENMLQ